MKTSLRALTFALSITGVCTAQTTPLNLNDLTLVWSDEFNGTTLDTTKWRANDGQPRQGASTWMKKEVSVSNGNLRLGITATKIPTNSSDTANYDCGSVETMKDWTNALFEKTYGYFEARCKLPARIDADYWAAFWMMAGTVSDTQPSTQLGHETDIMESFTVADGGKHKLTMHWNGYGTLHNIYSLNCGAPVNLRDGGFHVYGLYWDQNVYISYVDGVEVGRTSFIGLGSSTGGKTLSDGTCRKPGHIILSCEAAQWPGGSGWESPFPASDEFLVDYVRVYTVSDTTPPTISTLNPADNATGVAVGANLVATFSEAIAKGTGDITIKNLSDGTQTTIAITDAQVTASGTTLTINPTVDLVGDKSYAIQIASTAIKDLADNAFAGITDDTTWNFATVPPDTTAPTPNPMTFASPPSATSQTSITMTATTASDPSGVEYFFECTAGGGNSSGWQDSPVYTDTGLTSETEYTYRVRARDKSPTQTATAWSATASATALLVGFNQHDAGPWDYNTTGNWHGGTINGLWDSLLTLSANQTVTFAADTSAGTGLIFNHAGNFSLLLQSSSTTTRNLTLGGGISLDTGGGTTANVTIGSSSNPLPINLGGATRTAMVADKRTLTLSNVVSNGGITKTGAGTLTLAGDNSYTGVTTIGTGAGRIVVAHNNALGTTAGNTTIAANGATGLVVNSGITTAENITITGTTEALDYAAAISGGGTLSGTITLGTGTGDIRMGGVTFSGTITQTGTRVLVLNGTTINNAITINGAKLAILNGTSILKGVSGNGIGQTALDQGGVLQLGVTNALNTTNDLNIGTYSSQDGTFDLASYNQTIRGLTSGSTGTARKVINSVASTTSTLTVGNGNGTYTFSGTILNNNGTGGTVALVKTGTGTQTLSGANTYSGPTTIGNGILILSNALAMQNSALDTTGSIAGTSSVGLRTTVTTLTLGGLTGNKNFAATGGVFSTTSGGYGSVTALTLNPGTGASHSYAGVIAAGNANMTLTKTGAGTQTLTGVNTYTGHTSVSAGTLKITGAGRLYGPAFNGTAVVTVQTGGVLELDTWAYGTGESLGQLAKEAARIVINNGTIRMNGTTTYGRGVTVLAGGATFEAAAGANWTHGGADLTANVYTGNPSLTFTGAGTGTFAKAFSGSSGSLTKSGAGTWTLSVANTYSGGTQIDAGTLALGASGSINASASVTIEPGATLDTSLQSYTIPTGKPVNFGIDGTGSGSSGKISAAALNVSNATVTYDITGPLDDAAYVLATYDPAPGSLTGTFLSAPADPVGYTLNYAYEGNKIALVQTGGNTNPTISDIANQSVSSGGNTGALAFTVGDAETAPGALIATGSSSNTTLLPNANVVIAGNGGIDGSRTVTVTPVSGLVGSATITVTVTDGGSLTAQDTFTLTVTDNYLSWAASQVPPVTGGVNGDDDNDGVKNLVEYALVDGGDRGALSVNTITYTKRGGVYGTDLTYIIETSETLASGSWSDVVTHGPAQLGSPISYTFTPGTPVKEFARLKVVTCP